MLLGMKTTTASMITDWFAWAYGKTLAAMSDGEIQTYARRAWDTCDGDQLRAFRAEGARRNIRVV
jgi:hypothetical protein